MSNWKSLIEEILDDSMRDEWGWGKNLRAAPKTILENVSKNCRAYIDASGLLIPYYCGWIEVIFSQPLQAAQVAFAHRVSFTERRAFELTGAYFSDIMGKLLTHCVFDRD